MHKTENVYKNISKDLGVHQSTMWQMFNKLRKFRTVATLPISWHPAKITPTEQPDRDETEPNCNSKGLQRPLQG